jgi:mono/diheme cytochrome c family protein
LKCHREIYFQLLDSEGRELQRQTSAVQLMPGETQSCIGCHEPRNQAPKPVPSESPNSAWHRRPSEPKFPDCTVDGIVDFVGVVQPVLDRHCVECHSGVDPAAGYDLTGDKTRLFNMAYDNLLGRSGSYRQHNMKTGQILPAEAAKGKPLVHYHWLLKTPTGVSRPYWIGSHASRLPDYLEKSHVGHELPSEDKQRIYLWIDANVPYYATYEHSRPKSPGYRDLFTDFETGQLADWYSKQFLPVYKRRCNECHGPIPEPNDKSNVEGPLWRGRYSWINMTRPELSVALVTHLSKEAGRRGTGTETGGKGKPLFSTKDDPDFKAMLEAIRQGAKEASQHPRVDFEQSDK